MKNDSTISPISLLIFTLMKSAKLALIVDPSRFWVALWFQHEAVYLKSTTLLERRWLFY